tara:strand:- start:236 stop:469 length:234 start_codon:yes stop_codon:yes gene_type:complete
MSWKEIIKEKETNMSFDKFKTYVQDAYEHESDFSIKLDGKPIDIRIAVIIMWLSADEPKIAYNKLISQGFELIDEGE